MDMLGKVRRMHMRDRLSISEIARRTGLSRNKVRRWLRARARAERKPPIGHELIRLDGSVIRYAREEDDHQKPVDHYRTVDTLALMLRNGSITGAMHDAGQQFSQDFARAFGRDSLPAGSK